MVNKNELWGINGTVQGTVLAKDIRLGVSSNGSFLMSFTLNKTQYFAV
jgi:ELWxxDGT repeat protein